MSPSTALLDATALRARYLSRRELLYLSLARI